MGARHLVIVEEIRDVDAAWRAVLTRETEAWWNRGARAGFKAGRYTEVAIPPGAPRHISAEQAEQGVMAQFVPDENKFGPWLAWPLGPTETTTVTITGTMARGDAWRLVDRDEHPTVVLPVTPEPVAVTFEVEDHKPVGDPTGWVFYGWVNT